MTSTTRPVAPIPMSISEAARAYLDRPAIDAPIYPAVEDRAAWLAMIEQRDQSIAQRFTDDGLAVTGRRRVVAGSALTCCGRKVSPTLTPHRSFLTCMAVD